MASRSSKAPRKKTTKRKPGLATLRKRIDTIDHELVELMNKRADV
ncbi:MAG: prephenate dehydratase, partial [Planctomycetaceae bacterium]|nr:prephenate dehydratase [Planctomycetaceae bacterium]